MMQVKNENELFKNCSICKKSFLIETHFQSHMKPEGTKQCLKCRNGAIKYKNNPTSVNQKRKNIYLSHKRKTIEKTRGCQWSEGCRFDFSDRLETFLVCDEYHNLVIYEFDHILPKEKSFCVSNWYKYSAKYSEQYLYDEIAKCRILCRFHHQIHSKNQHNEKKKTRVYSEKHEAVRKGKLIKKNKENLCKLKLDIGKCQICQREVLSEETTGFDFDHIDRVTKHRSISLMVCDGYAWKNSILPEIEKCRLVCAICHIMHTQAQNKDENEKNICRKRKYLKLPRDCTKEELEICVKGERPTRDELYDLVLKYTFVEVGKRYQVKGCTIIYWCKKEGIPHKRRKLMEEEFI